MVERNRPQDSHEGPPALFPVSFAQAKDWLIRQQKAQSTALETGAVNKEAREVVADLNRSLEEQPEATAALLNQPARLASPMVPPPAMSLGPEAVSNQERAEERKRKSIFGAKVTGTKGNRGCPCSSRDGGTTIKSSSSNGRARCPYADNDQILVEFDREKKEKTQEAWLAESQ